MGKLRFDEAFLSTFGRSFDRSQGAAFDARRQENAQAHDDEVLQKRMDAQRGQEDRALKVHVGDRKEDAERRLAERMDETKRRESERADDAMRRGKEREDDRTERDGFRKDTREDNEYAREYQRSLNAFSQTDPAESAARIRPLFAKQAQGGALTPGERAQLEAGRDVYGMMRKQAATPRLIEQTVKSSDPTDPTKEIFQKVKVPDPTWKPVQLPPFEAVMMPEASKFMNGGPINPAFGAPAQPAAPADPMASLREQTAIRAKQAATKQAEEEQRRADAREGEARYQADLDAATDESIARGNANGGGGLMGWWSRQR